MTRRVLIALCAGFIFLKLCSCFSPILSKRLTVKTCLKKSELSMGILDGIKKMVNQDPKVILEQENDLALKKYSQTVERINSLEADFEKLSNEQLEKKTDEFRIRLKSGSTLDSLLVEAFAVVREASWRVLELRHYDVQLIGGMALFDGRLAEMATGEGKTLVALLPTYLNALTGQGAFVVTTNDYLARRDGENIGQVLRFLGMSVGVIQSYQKEPDRRAAYSCDVTYVANQDLGFDFLRDNLAMSSENVVQQRAFNFCLVDEVDSILIDEARTPLIISRKAKAPTEKYFSCAQIASELKKGVHYEVDLKNQKVEMTAAGFKFCEQIIGKGLFEFNDPWAFYIINALKAKELFTKDKEYIIKDGNVFIVDSFSGRVLEGRRFTDGIQQSIEAKEKIKVSEETQIVAKITYQNLFRLFPRLCGMTGTAMTEASEFSEIYKLNVLPIPTALPMARRDNDDAVFRTQEGKMKALLRNVLSTHEKGRPILIGTTSVQSSEEMMTALNDIGIKAKLLNARPDIVERESEIIAQAGCLGAVTVATNMAGRGTDILLGGNTKGIAKAVSKQMMLVKLGIVPPPKEVVPQEDSENVEEVENETDPDVLSLPSIASIAADLDLWIPHGLSKSAELNLKRAVISCLDDMGDKANRLEVEDAIARASDSGPISTVALKLLRQALATVTKELEETVKLEREKVKRLGGLYVIGTARHESRRIDNQLRGRAGRQGDPGGTRFFLSFEDDIFKIFGGEKMGTLLESFRVADDMPIESDLVVQALDKVQSQVEDYFQANRKQVFKLDEVTATQRTLVYEKRRNFLYSSDDRMLELFSQYCEDTMNEIYDASLVDSMGKDKPSRGGPVDVPKLISKAATFFPNIKLSAEDVSSCSQDKLQSLLQSRLLEAINEKRLLINSNSAGAFVTFFRYLSLVQTDESWCKHLTRLDILKEEMVLQSFTAERDVLEIYKEKANLLFYNLFNDVRRNSVYSLFIYKPNAEMAKWTK